MTLIFWNFISNNPKLVKFWYDELTKRPPGACQLDKGAAPPYNPLLLACGQHLRHFVPTIAIEPGRLRTTLHNP